MTTSGATKYPRVVNAIIEPAQSNDQLVSYVVDGLDDQQRAAVVSPASRLCIVASAGSGKTRVVVKRIEYLCKESSVSASHIVAITFTRKAGFELATRLTTLFPETTRERPFVGTLHSFTHSELSSYHREHGTKMRTLVENSHSILKELSISRPHHFSRALSWAKTRLMNRDHVTDDVMSAIRRNCHISHNSLDRATFLTEWAHYEKYCRSKNLMDHDDILIEYCNRLANDSYRQTRQYLYRHLFVDEFQDTTPLHMEIYRRLVGETGCISVVGDPDQSIFSFAGSSDVYLNNFTDYFPGAETIFLTTNYRSTRANVEVSRSVIESDHFREIRTPRPSTVLPQVHVYPDHIEEAAGVMEIISTAHARGRAMNDIAVLVRTNDQKNAFVDAANKLGIAYHRGRQVINDPVAAEVLSVVSSLRKKRRWRSIYDALDDIDGAQVILGQLDENHRTLFSDLRSSARQYMTLFPHDRQGDVAGFFEFIESQLISERDKHHGFSLLTFHQAKGLEFHTVVVSGFEQGIVPLYNDKKRKQEEARLAYVALSRATDELHITRASVRERPRGVTVQKPSEFLTKVKEHISDIDIRNDVFSAEEAGRRIADIRAKYL